MEKTIERVNWANKAKQLIGRIAKEIKWKELKIFEKSLAKSGWQCWN
jgi:hypothetical protein